MCVCARSRTTLSRAQGVWRGRIGSVGSPRAALQPPPARPGVSLAGPKVVKRRIAARVEVERGGRACAQGRGVGGSDRCRMGLQTRCRQRPPTASRSSCSLRSAALGCVSAAGRNGYSASNAQHGVGCGGGRAAVCLSRRGPPEFPGFIDASVCATNGRHASRLTDANERGCAVHMVDNKHLRRFTAHGHKPA